MIENKSQDKTFDVETSTLLFLLCENVKERICVCLREVQSE